MKKITKTIAVIAIALATLTATSCDSNSENNNVGTAGYGTTDDGDGSGNGGNNDGKQNPLTAEFKIFPTVSKDEVDCHVVIKNVTDFDKQRIKHITVSTNVNPWSDEIGGVTEHNIAFIGKYGTWDTDYKLDMDSWYRPEGFTFRVRSINTKEDGSDIKDAEFWLALMYEDDEGHWIVYQDYEYTYISSEKFTVENVLKYGEPLIPPKPQIPDSITEKKIYVDIGFNEPDEDIDSPWFSIGAWAYLKDAETYRNFKEIVVTPKLPEGVTELKYAYDGEPYELPIKIQDLFRTRSKKFFIGKHVPILYEESLKKQDIEFEIKAVDKDGNTIASDKITALTTTGKYSSTFTDEAYWYFISDTEYWEDRLDLFEGMTCPCPCHSEKACRCTEYCIIGFSDNEEQPLECHCDSCGCTK